VIGTTNVSVPLLAAVGTGFGSIQDIVNTATTANLAFLIIGLVASGMVMLLSLVSIFLPRNRPVVLVNLTSAVLAPLFLLVSAVFTSVLIWLITTTVNGIGSALTISATAGSKALTLGWVAWAFSVVSSVYWSLVWFVSYRRTALVRTRRGEGDIGNWKGIIGQIRRNLRISPGKA
jgi:hypothetical protein